MTKTLIIFTSPACAPCAQLKRTIEQASLPEGMTYREIDVEKNPQEAMRYGVRGLPTTVVADADGYPIAMYTGAMSVSAFEDFIRGAAKGE